jgi:hypothetical protein
VSCGYTTVRDYVSKIRKSHSQLRGHLLRYLREMGYGVVIFLDELIKVT